MFLVAWKNAAGDIVTANTQITGNMTLTAEWTATVDTRYIEKITTTAGGVGAALYAFELPDGSKIGDYTQFTFKTKVDVAIANNASRFRAWGPLNTAAQNTSATLPNLNANNVLAMANADAPGGDLLCTAGIGGNFNQTVASGWVTRTLEFNSTKPSKWNNGDTTGIILFAMGAIGPAGGEWVGSYYIKDIALTKAGGADPVAVLDPRDAKLWNGERPGAHTRASGASIVITREFLPYEE
jgi:hypothetical protein